MKKPILIVAGAVLIVLFSFRPGNSVHWTLDKPEANLGFTVSHLMISDVTGYFKNFDAKLVSSGDDFTNAEAEMTAQTNSIDSGNETRDNDLRSEKYLDTKKFPQLTFKSKSFKKGNGQHYNVTADLTIKGITKTVVFDAICRTGINPMNKKEVAGFKISGKIKRMDFGIATSTPAAMIGDEISVFADVRFSKSEGIAEK